MQVDFDRIHSRRDTGSLKWEYVRRGGDLIPRVAGPDPFAADQPLPLWLADMDFKAPQPVLDALAQRVQHGIFGYSRPNDAYFAAIVNWFQRRHGWQVQPEWILTTSGVVQAMNMALQSFTEPGDQVIVPTPVFDPIILAVTNNGRAVLRSPLRFENGRYALDFDDLAARAAHRRTKMLILCSPHNPVGRVWSRDELVRLGKICLENDLLVLSDEIHGDIIYPWARFTTFGAADPAFNAHLILCGGASKSFNLPGMHTAYTIIPNEVLRRRFTLTLRNLGELFSVNIMGTLALQAAYEYGETWLTELMAYLEANLNFLQAYLKQHLPGVRLVWPEALFLLWLDCRRLGLDGGSLERLFSERAGVHLENGRQFGVEGEGFVRINIACPRTVLAEALRRMATAVTESSRR